MKPEIYAIVTAVNELTRQMAVDADRIEKLEAALRSIIVHCEVPAPPNAEALKIFARKALEGKDE